METRKEQSLKIYEMYELPYRRMVLRGHKDIVLGLRDAVLMGLLW